MEGETLSIQLWSVLGLIVLRYVIILYFCFCISHLLLCNIIDNSILKLLLFCNTIMKTWTKCIVYN